jgi:GYD domain
MRSLFWTMGAYDVVLLLDAPDDETISAFSLKIGSLGNVKSQTMRAFRAKKWKAFWRRSNSSTRHAVASAIASHLEQRQRRESQQS